MGHLDRHLQDLVGDFFLRFIFAFWLKFFSQVNI
jgi:hypothetical protein